MTAARDQAGVAACVDGLLADRPAGGAVRLGPFLRQITDRILDQSSPGDLNLLTHSHRTGGMIRAAQARPVGLIVGELVTNAIIYAHPAGVAGRIDVSSVKTTAEGGLTIEVSDDGVGLPERFDPLVDGGAGLNAVRSLAGQLGATLHFSDSGVGLSVRLDVPVTGSASAITLKVLN